MENKNVKPKSVGEGLVIFPFNEECPEGFDHEHNDSMVTTTIIIAML